MIHFFTVFFTFLKVSRWNASEKPYFKEILGDNPLKKKLFEKLVSIIKQLAFPL